MAATMWDGSIGSLLSRVGYGSVELREEHKVGRDG